MRRLAAVLIPCALLLASCATTPPPEPVDQEIENLRAFAKLYGYVRWFHPSDEAAALDWDRFAVYGAERVRHAENTAELKQALSALFHPIAPTLDIHDSDAGPRPVPLDCPEPPTEWVAWQHAGVYLGVDSQLYRSHRLNRETAIDSGQAHGFGQWWKQLEDAESLRGKRMRVRAHAKLDPKLYNARAMLTVAAMRGEVSTPAYSSPIISSEWNEATVVADIPQDVSQIYVGGTLIGAGSAWFDAFVLEAMDPAGAWHPIPLGNNGFESDEGWQPFMKGDYEHSFVDDQAHEGRRAAFITGQPSAEVINAPLFDAEPGDGERVYRELGSGLAATFPISVPSVDGRTCHRPDTTALDELQAAIDLVDPADISSPGTRFAASIVVWNVFQHFYPYFDQVDVDWDLELTRSLVGARDSDDARAMLSTLRTLVAATRDGHGWVMHPETKAVAQLPFATALIEDRVVVVASDDDAIRRGDVVLSVDNVDARENFAAVQAQIAGSDEWRRVRARNHFGEGPRDSFADAVVKRSGEQIDVRVQRTGTQAQEQPLLEPVHEVADGIWYVDLSRPFDAAFTAAMDELTQAEGLIIDMRGYPAGQWIPVLDLLSDEPLFTARFLVPQYVAPDQVGVTFQDRRWQLPGQEPRIAARAVFLTGNRAISAAETVMGVVEGHKLGEIIGQPTAGTNGNINIFRVPGGFRAALTGMRVEKHDGSQHHLVGIQPTVPIEPTIAAIREGRDEYIEKAVEIIQAGAGGKQ